MVVNSKLGCKAIVELPELQHRQTMDSRRSTLAMYTVLPHSSSCVHCTIPGSLCIAAPAHYLCPFNPPHSTHSPLPHPAPPAGAAGGVYHPPKLNPVSMEEDREMSNRDRRRLKEAQRKAKRRWVACILHNNGMVMTL